MKILFCSLAYSLLTGGTASINTSIDGFNQRGVKSLIISPDYGTGETRKEHRLAPSSTIVRGIGILVGRKERIFGIGSRAKIEEINRKFKPDAYWLHTITWTSNAFEEIMFKSDKPKVVSYHTTLEDYGRIYAGEIGAVTMKMRSRIVCNKADAIIIPSETMKARLIEYGVTKPIHVIPTGIVMPDKKFSRKEVCERFGIDQNSKILLHLGRISKEKNIEALLRVVKKVNQRGLRSTLLFVGPGDINKTARDAKELGIAEQVIFTGGLPREEALKVYGGCDAFIFSSQTETQGLVIGESMAAETPVIALRSPIQAEIYPEGTAAIANDESDFVEKILVVLKNDKEVKMMVEKAKKFVQDNFSQKLMIDRQLKVFQDLRLKTKRKE